MDTLRLYIAACDASHLRIAQSLITPAAEVAEVARVHAAISAGIEGLRREVPGWTSPTDNDRLNTAFVQLEAQGLVVFGPEGDTRDGGIAIAARRAAALDEAGPERHGFCFFHRQDAWSAIEGHGLMLAFGSLRSEEPAATAQIGRLAVEALAAAGLRVQWDGSPGTRIVLPDFVWRARPRWVSEADVQAFLADWETELRARADAWASADRMFDDLVERASEAFAGHLDFGPDMLAALAAHTERFVAAEVAAEATWSEPTTNDRLSAALTELADRGVLSNNGAGLTLQDAWAYVGIAAREREARGGVACSAEDLIDGVEGRGLRLGFCAREDAAPYARTLALGAEIVEILQAHGVPCSWSGAAHERIVISPFPWRLRRTTAAPAHTRVAPPTGDRPAPPEPSRWQRWFGGFRSTPPARPTSPAARPRALAAGHTRLVTAPRDARGFDLIRSRTLRSAFEGLGGGQAHVCHVGVPTAFVPTGDFFVLGAMSAGENLIDEAVPLWRRGERR
jgi:hypothetical protein